METTGAPAPVAIVPSAESSLVDPHQPPKRSCTSYRHPGITFHPGSEGVPQVLRGTPETLMRMRAAARRATAPPAGSVVVRLCGAPGFRLEHLTLRLQLLVRFVRQVGDGDPGMRHLVRRAVTRADPLVWIGVVRVVRGVVIPRRDDQHRALRQ